MVNACRLSLSDATRAGILVTVPAKARGVGHFLIAASHVRAELAEQAAEE